MYRGLACLLLLSGPAQADRLVAAQTIPARSIIDASDLRFEEDPAAVAIDPELVIGQETTITLYSGKAIRLDDLRAPTRVERNQIVTIFYRNGLVEIEAEGRALARGATGDRIRVMNNSSKATVLGKVLPDGTILVAGS